MKGNKWGPGTEMGGEGRLVDRGEITGLCPTWNSRGDHLVGDNLPSIHREGHRIKVGRGMAGRDTGKVWIEALWASLSFCVGRKGLRSSFLVHGKKKTQVKSHVICHRVNALKRQTRLVSRAWWKQRVKQNARLPNTPRGTSVQRAQTGLDQQRQRAWSPASSQDLIILKPLRCHSFLGKGRGGGGGKRGSLRAHPEGNF